MRMGMTQTNNGRLGNQAESSKNEDSTLASNRPIVMLSESNYPELYKKFNELADRIEKDHPPYKVPRHIQITNGEMRSAMHFAGTEDTHPVIQISKTIVENFPIEQSLAILAHEVGHDFLNHSPDNVAKQVDEKMEEILKKDPRFQNFDPSNIEQQSALNYEREKITARIRRQEVREADGFAKEYGFGAPLAKALERVESENNAIKKSQSKIPGELENPVTVFDMHPPLEERVKMLQKPRLELDGCKDEVNQVISELGVQLKDAAKDAAKVQCGTIPKHQTASPRSL